MCGHHPKNLKKTAPKEQNTRGESVRTLADELKTDNWEVKAKLEGWEKPAKLGAFTPDIDAKKGSLRRICEVLTEKDFEGDKERYIELRNYCDEYDFRFYVVDKNGIRRQIDPKNFGKE